MPSLTGQGGVLAELVKKRLADHDYLPPFLWAENNKLTNHADKFGMVFLDLKIPRLWI